MQNYEYTVDEIAELLGVTKGRAYKGIGRLSDELKVKVLRVISISTKDFVTTC